MLGYVNVRFWGSPSMMYPKEIQPIHNDASVMRSLAIQEIWCVLAFIGTLQLSNAVFPKLT